MGGAAAAPPMLIPPGGERFTKSIQNWLASRPWLPRCIRSCESQFASRQESYGKIVAMPRRHHPNS